jgi:nicotinate phosphoribosyltransferase
MLDASLRAGVAGRPVTFEVFTRRLPDDREYGVFCGLGRLLDALQRFRFDDAALNWLASRRIVSDEALDWLAAYRFSGDVWAYPEGDLFVAGSPVLTVVGPFGESVLLETIVLSILNHDTAVASAAARIVTAAGDRPVIEMGSRRTDAEAAVSAARAAWIAGFASTSNLAAGERYGIPTAGTAAHAFTLVFAEERQAFTAQIRALGHDTTLLVDTYDTEQGIRAAVAASAGRLGAVRIDSGRLGEEAVRARRLLDELGAASTRIVVTGDLDEDAIRRLAAAPVDGYGVGTSVVTGAGSPTAGFVYKLVAAGADGPGAPQRPTAKRSPGKATVAGRKWAWRLLDGDGLAVGEDVSLVSAAPQGPARQLHLPVVRGGVVLAQPELAEVREHHRRSRAELPPGRRLPMRVRPAPS